MQDRSPVRLLALLLLSAVPFALFAHNSGYGYDALEYLILGRSLNDGFVLYDFVPSKSPGIYVVVATLLRLGLSLGHVSLSVVIAALYASMILTTFAVVRRAIDAHTAAYASALVAGCAWFMELNFLQPTGFVYLCGLGGYACCVRALGAGGRSRDWLAAGLCVGVGLQFKTVAAFYGAAGLLSLLLWQRRDRAWALPALAAGALAPTLLVWLFFAASGRGAAHLQWTYYFPLLEYPSNTYYLSKLYTKLLFFVVLFCGSLLWSLRAPLRARLWSENATRVACLFGIVSLLALLKTQYSHYFFPAATFLSIFTARVLVLASPRLDARAQRRRILAVGSAGLLLAASVLLYRPSAVARLVTVKSFDDEAPLRDFVQHHVSPQQHVLAFRDSTQLYWVSHRYPNLPLINMDVQSTRYLELHPGTLQTALADAQLVLVELNPDHPDVEDPLLLTTPGPRAQLDALRVAVTRDFTRALEGPPDHVFWSRP